MRKCVNWLFLAGAGLFVVIGILVFNYLILPIFIRQQVAKTLVLNEGTSDAWDRFVKLPVPLVYNVYFFNLVNVDGIFRGEKPVVQEVGPWVYKEYITRHNFKFDDNKDTVTYQQKTIYEFDPERSKPRTEEDLVQPANLLPQLVYTLCDRLPEVSFLEEILEPGFIELYGEGYQMTLNRTVKDILFDGLVAHCPENATVNGKLLCSVLKHFPGIRSMHVEDNGDLSVSILGFNNGTLRDPIEIYRGNKDFDKFGTIVSVNGKEFLTDWPGDECNSVIGSFSESLLKPLITEDTSFNVYADEICRTTPLSYDKYSTENGIDCLRFKLDDKFFGTVEDYPENYCYCPSSVHGITLGQGCMRKGTFEVSPCHAVPAVLSPPHFLQASESYLEAIDGLSPNPDKHETFIALEPTTGIPITAAKRMQINFQFRGTPSLKKFGAARDVLMPFLWVEEKVELPEKELSLIRNQLLKVMSILKIVKWVLIVVGAIMFLIGCTMAYLSARKEHQHPD